jgi:addiction module HigA family antidote
MNNLQNHKFAPDYLVTPGEVLAEYLDELRMTQAELADRTGLTQKNINKIIKTKAPITSGVALKLERTLGRDLPGSFLEQFRTPLSRRSDATCQRNPFALENISQSAT